MSAKKAKAAKKVKTAKAAKKASMAKKGAAKKLPAAKAKAAKKAPPAAKKARPASSWLDEATNHPLIADKAQQLGSFLAAMADGVIDEAEVEAQEQRLVRTMKRVEPMLSAEQHAKVTELLVEITAYDLMKVMHSFHQARPKTAFQG